MILAIFLIIIGFALLIGGADLLVDGSSGIAKKLHIPEIIIGLTIVSIGTSMPELFVSVTSALEGHSDMALGNIIGSNLSNLLLILGLSSVIKPVVFQKETRLYEIPMCLFITIIFMLFCNTSDKITTLESVLLIVMFAMFIIYTIYMGIKQSREVAVLKDKERESILVKSDIPENITVENKEKQDKLKQEKSSNILKNILFVIVGVITLKIGGDLAVDNAVIVANHFGLSEKLISLTILAVGTSLPELVTSVTAAIKGNSDIAIGNIIGSNIFNMLLIIGVSSGIKEITYNTSYNLDLIILLLSTIVLALFPFIPPKNEMSRKNGMIYVAMYIGYLGILIAL